MAALKENPIYVLVNNPADTRKRILTSGIEAIKSLEGYEDFKKLRTLKRKKFLDLNNKIDGIHDEIGKLLEFLPSVQGKTEKVSNKKESKSKIEETAKSNLKVNSLSREIKSIQDKLARLNI